MATHDYVISNQSFPSTRTDINNVLAAIVSNNSNSTAPATTFANMIWYDTANNKLYIRNEDNDAWIELFVLDQSGDHLEKIGDTITLDGSGNVGIGTSTVSEVLHLHRASGSCAMKITDSITGTGTGDGFEIGKDTSQRGFIWNYENADTYFATNNTERMRIDNTSAVLINQTSRTSVSTSWAPDTSPLLQHSGTGSLPPVMMLANPQNTNGGGIGSIAFANQNNSDASAATHRVVAAFNVDCATSDNNASDDSGSNLRFYTKSEGGTLANSMTLSGGQNLTIVGSLSKGSGSFKIPHPLDSLSDTHNLVHSFVEAPQADNIYRGTVDLVAGTASVNIDTVSGMTDGTFVALNREIQCFTSNETGWTAIKGSVSGNTLTITAQDNTCTDTISWLVIGERKDAHMYDTEWTDENGKVIVEPLKTDDIVDLPLPVDDGINLNMPDEGGE